MAWTPDKLDDQSGKTFVVTGGNSGLGLETAGILGALGARVVITSRTEAKAQTALETLRERSPKGEFDWVELDLADLDSVAESVEKIREAAPSIDALVNNAGVMQTPNRKTAQGFELQIGTNHLGHFRLNSLLLPHLESTGARIVPVASIAHKYGEIDVDDLNFEKRSYDPTVAYCQSKLANLMYGFELDRRLKERGSAVTAIPVHPGYAATNLQSTGVGMDGGSWFFRWTYKLTNAVMAQSAEAGAYPLVLAAAWSDAKRGTYYGPTGFQQTRGPVGETYVAPRARDEETSRRLWEKSEELVGAFFQ